MNSEMEIIRGNSFKIKNLHQKNQNLHQVLFTLILRIQIPKKILKSSWSKKNIYYATFQCGRYNVSFNFFLPMKTWKTRFKSCSKLAQFFFSTALSCPYDQELKKHIGNWAEAKCKERSDPLWKFWGDNSSLNLIIKFRKKNIIFF